MRGARQGQGAVRTPTPDPTAELLHADPADIDFALDRAEEVSQAISDQLQRALAGLGDIPTHPQEPLSAADNALSSAGTANNALWWDMLAQVPAESLRWAETEAALLLQARDRSDPRIPGLVRRHGTRDIMLLADTLDRFLWSEGATRLRHALACALPVEELVGLADALAEGGKGNRRPEHSAQLLMGAAMLWDPPRVAQLFTMEVEHEAAAMLMERAMIAMAWRSLEDVHSIIREVEHINPRLLPLLPLNSGILSRPTDEVLKLLDLLEQACPDQEVAYHGAFLIESLPELRSLRAFENTELMLHLWVRTEGFLDQRGRLLDSLLPRGRLPIAESIVQLRQPWSPPLEQAAEQILNKFVPVVISISTIADLKDIGTILANAGVDPDEVFGPYRDQLTISFDGPGNPSGRTPITWY